MTELPLVRVGAGMGLAPTLIDLLQQYETNFRTLPMDLLCALAAPPAITKLADLCADFGIKAQSEAKAILQSTGLRFWTKYIDGQAVVIINPDDWREIQPRLSEYWDRVNDLSHGPSSRAVPSGPAVTAHDPTPPGF